VILDVPLLRTSKSGMSANAAAQLKATLAVAEVTLDGALLERLDKLTVDYRRGDAGR
jgi:hypothetical protein